jgi:hypothetical protein
MTCQGFFEKFFVFSGYPARGFTGLPGRAAEAGRGGVFTKKK